MTGTVQHMMDGSETYSLDLGVDPDSEFGSGNWKVQEYVDGSLYRELGTAAELSDIVLDFVGEHSLKVGIKKPDNTYDFTDAYLTGLIGGNTAPGQAVGNKGNSIFGNEGLPLFFSVSASDPNNDTVTYRVRDAPSGSTFDENTGYFEWWPGSEDSGIYSVYFDSYDGYTYGPELNVILTINDTQ